MSRKRIQNRIADSRMALPITAVYAVMACLACGFIGQHLWWQFAMLVLSTYMMVELNNANALIRIYSRMVSCSYLVLTVMSPSLLMSVPHAATQMFLVAFFLLLFRCYQDKRAAGGLFYAFAMLGMASLAFVQILYFVPVVWVLLFTNIMAGNVRTWCASLLGLMLPYWCVGGYCVYVGQVDALYAHIEGLWQFAPLADVGAVSLSQALSVGVVVVVAVIGMVHFHRNSFMDKIRTRMLFEVFTTFILCIIVFAVLQPQHLSFLHSMLLVCVSPLAGHFISLTHTRATNVTFLALLAIVLGVTVYNIWMLS